MTMSPEAMAENMIANMQDKTGKSLPQSFTIVQPPTKTRVDLGLNLKGMPANGRLEASGSVSSMASHRVRLEKPADVDKDVKAWTRQAWQSS